MKTPEKITILSVDHAPRQTNAATPTNGLERFAGIAPLDLKTQGAPAHQRRPAPDKWGSYGL